jgi:tRNA(adenine34) deaminase
MSPDMGGVSKWNVLADNGLNAAMPEVFSPPPEIISGFMAKEAEQALIEWNPLIAEVIKRRGLFGAAPRVITRMPDGADRPSSLRERVLRFLRRDFFDYSGRR